MKLSSTLLVTCMLTFALVSSVTLITDGVNTYGITIAANSATSSNYDVVFTITDADTWTNAQHSSVLCTDTGASDYTLTADKTAMVSFAVHNACGGSCASYALITNTWYAGTCSYTHTGTVWASQAMTAQTAITPTTVNSSTSQVITLANMTSANLGTYGLPTSGNSAYLKCWGVFDSSTAVAFNAVRADASTSLTTTNTATLGQSAGFTGVVAALTVAGSLIISTAF